MWRESRCAEKIGRYLEFKALELCPHLNMCIIPYWLCVTMPFLNLLCALTGRLPDPIVTMAPDLREASFRGVIRFLHYSSTNKSYLFQILTKVLDLSLEALMQRKNLVSSLIMVMTPLIRSTSRANRYFLMEAVRFRWYETMPRRFEN